MVLFKKCVSIFVVIKIMSTFASTVPITPLYDAYHDGTSFYMKYEIQQITH